MTITEFLLARIAEDEQAAGQRVGEMESGVELEAGRGGNVKMLLIDPPQRWLDHEGAWGTLRVQRECEAKRHLLDESLVWGEGCATVIAQYMAEVYADHPDYDPEWRP